MALPTDPSNPGLPQGTPKVRLEDIMDVQDAEQKLTSIFKNSIKNLESESKEAFSKLSFGIDKVIKEEEKKALDTHKQFLKATLSADRFHIEELKSQRDELMKKVEDEAITERNLIIGSLKDKKDREDAYNRHKLQTAEKLAKVQKTFNNQITESAIRATAKEIGFSEAAVGGMMKYATKANIVTGILAGVVAVLSKALSLSRQFAEVQAAVRGAGFEGTMGVGAMGQKTGDVGKIFETLTSATRNLNLRPEEIRQFIVTLSDAPKALREIDAKGASELMGFAGAMADIGIDLKTSMQIAAGASNDLNASSRRLTETYKTAKGITSATGMNTKMAFNTLLNLSGSLRSLTFNAEEASKVLVATALPLQRMGFSNIEIQKFASNLAGVLGQLSPSKMAGLMGFVKGRMPTREELTKGGGLETMVDFFNQALSGFEKGSAERLFAVEALAKDVGLTQATTIKGAEAWEAVLDDVSKLEEFSKKFKPTEEKMLDITERGFTTLIDMKSPLEHLTNKAVQFFEDFSGPFMDIMKNINRLVASYSSKTNTYQEYRQDLSTIGNMNFSDFRNMLPRSSYRSNVERDMDRNIRERQYRQMEEYKRSQLGSRY